MLETTNYQSQNQVVWDEKENEKKMIAISQDERIQININPIAC